jgi:hypothetical protein
METQASVLVFELTGKIDGLRLKVIGKLGC